LQKEALTKDACMHSAKESGIERSSTEKVDISKQHGKEIP
jgi:hypothetical protein